MIIPYYYVLLLLLVFHILFKLSQLFCEWSQNREFTSYTPNREQPLPVHSSAKRRLEKLPVPTGAAPECFRLLSLSDIRPLLQVVKQLSFLLQKADKQR